MRIAAIVIACIALAACGRLGMSRQEVIAAVKDCEAADMESRVLVNALDIILDVQCVPKRGDSDAP